MNAFVSSAVLFTLGYIVWVLINIANDMRAIRNKLYEREDAEREQSRRVRQILDNARRERESA